MESTIDIIFLIILYVSKQGIHTCPLTDSLRAFSIDRRVQKLSMCFRQTPSAC